MIGEILGLSAIVATNAGINVGIYKYFNSKLERVYQRLDMVKDKLCTEFVRKEVCDVLHKQTADNLARLEDRINERFNDLELETRENFNKVIDLITKR